MTRRQAGPQSGFSLIELMVALTVTLVVSGAIYGLLSGGQSAFRREPELTDRQQNARVALNLIMRDIANAGSGMPKFIQTFSQNLNNCTNNATCPVDTGRITRPDVPAEVPDELEMLTNSGTKENEPACHTPGNGNSSQVRTVRQTNQVQVPQIVLLFTTTGLWTIREVVNTSTNNSGAGNCDNAQHTGLNFNSGQDTTGLNRPSGVCEPNGWGTIVNNGACEVSEVSFATVVRYRVRLDASGVPVLQRWSSDDTNLLTGGNLTYQTIARGIEDLEVQYTKASTPNTWVDGAPQVVNNDYTTLITQVRITLVARAEGHKLQGEKTSASGRTNVRGTLTSVGTPRATLVNLNSAPAAQRQWF
ncbi:MAG TPA: PilW family protein [Vicinamibacteria bacterium]|nr:PilW family protein [Vicinamibacteria bacterium]